jgi:hypothetical protein
MSKLGWNINIALKQLVACLCAKILGHSNIKMTERYAELGRAHMAKTGGTAREMWKLLGSKEKGTPYSMFPHCSRQRN